VTGEWRKLHIEELPNLYSSPDIIRQVKSNLIYFIPSSVYITTLFSNYLLNYICLNIRVSTVRRSSSVSHGYITTLHIIP
jgi:hypothetical protein